MSTVRNNNANGNQKLDKNNSTVINKPKNPNKITSNLQKIETNNPKDGYTVVTNKRNLSSSSSSTTSGIPTPASSQQNIIKKNKKNIQNNKSIRNFFS